MNEYDREKNKENTLNYKRTMAEKKNTPNRQYHEKDREEACKCTISGNALYDFAMIAGAATPAVPGTDAVETLLTDRFCLHR